jgi:hypothetical protein
MDKEGNFHYKIRQKHFQTIKNMEKSQKGKYDNNAINQESKISLHKFHLDEDLGDLKKRRDF